MTRPTAHVMVAVLVLAVMLASFGVSVYETPSRAPKTYASTVLTLKVLSVTWTTVGCSIAKLSEPGGTVSSAQTFSESAVLENSNVTSGCSLSSVSLSGGSYQLVDTAISLEVPAHGSATVTVSIQAPQFNAPTSLQLTLTGSDPSGG